MINPKNNDVTVAGTELFADSESFLNELTDSELGQIVGGLEVGVDADGNKIEANFGGRGSNISLLVCQS